MAFMNVEKKRTINEELKKVKKNFDGHLKYSLRIEHHMKLHMTITECSIDLLKEAVEQCREKHGGTNSDHFDYALQRGHLQLNPYHIRSMFAEDSEARKLLGSLVNALNCINHNNSDISVDYFDVGYYVHVSLGRWNKPFTVVEK